MGKHNIEKYSLFYTVLKAITGFWHNWVYYRRVIAVGRENFDRSKHNIIVSNHQNALMDPLAIIFTSKGQLIFLTRASAFKNRFIARILYTLKMLPVFRPRDGWDTLKHNDDTFAKTMDVIKSKNGLALMPEGNHAGYRRLRQLQKGVCRIAFMTEESESFGLDIQIVPVAVEYSNYFKFRQTVTVEYGMPFGFSELNDLYRENPQLAINELRDKIAFHLRDLMVHIETEEDYEAVDELRELVNGKHFADKNHPKVHRDKELIAGLEKAETESPELYREICNKALKIKNIASSLNIGYYHLNRKNPGLIVHMISILSLVVLAPLALYGFITNLVFYRIPNITLKNIRDPQFLSTFRFGVSLAMAFLFIPVYAVLAFVFIPQWWLAMVVFISILPAGLLAWNYFIIWKRLREGIRVRKYGNRNNPEYKILKNLYSDLMKDIEKLNLG